MAKNPCLPACGRALTARLLGEQPLQQLHVPPVPYQCDGGRTSYLCGRDFAEGCAIAQTLLTIFRCLNDIMNYLFALSHEKIRWYTI